MRGVAMPRAGTPQIAEEPPRSARRPPASAPDLARSLEEVIGLAAGGALAVTPQGSRASVHLVTGRSGAWIVKQVARSALAHGSISPAAELEREARLCAIAHAIRGPSGDPVAPRVCKVTPDRRSAVFEALVDWTSLHDLFEFGDEREDPIAQLLGRTIAALHNAKHVQCQLRAPSPVPDFWDVDPSAAAAMTAGSLDFLVDVQLTPGLADGLSELSRRSSRSVLTHGDVKLDNVLVRDGDDLAVALVDWELGGIGDPEWDVGSVAGDYLFRWLRSIRPRRGNPCESWLREANVSRTRVATLIARVIDGYEHEAQRQLEHAALGRYVGLYLLQRAQVVVEACGSYSPHARALAHVGKRLCVEPERTWVAMVPEGSVA